MITTLTQTKRSASMRMRSTPSETFLKYVAQCVCVAMMFLSVETSTSVSAATRPSAAMVELGRALFDEPLLGRDGRTRCHSCHNPARAYTDANERSIGVTGRRGTRNAPSLVGVESRRFIFWDGRRSSLDAAVLDPLTNPAEMGWPSLSDLTRELQKHPTIVRRFKAAFPEGAAWATGDQISKALVAFLGTLTTGTSDFDDAQAKHVPLPPQAELGRRLFTGAAQCSQCHTLDGDRSFTDEAFHHSSIGNVSQAEALPTLVATVASAHFDELQLGHKILTDAQWASLGRFVVSHRPADIGTFRTPSLRNVAVTAPYMHDGSIPTLSEAVDHEIYYRGFSNGRPINLSGIERQALVAFLNTLTDAEYTTSTARSSHRHSRNSIARGMAP